ncbi:UNVERIFIED_CONTAM: hypothetical protein Sradi_1890000 [Sesamum radiatum]|uniref:Myb/SANT-like domain-containing protein n=1 Tax=Sesamum radiatum TaxID=300843 RepID=A0AAW2U1N6_SESRA
MVNSKKQTTHAKFFYDRQWSKSQDVAFVNMLFDQARLGFRQSNPLRPNRISLDYATIAVNVFAETSHPREFYLNRLEVVRRRYNTFRRILDEPGFTWHEDTNRVLASKDAWKNLIRVVPFAKAYRYRGEPMWERLVSIFGPTVGGWYSTDDDSSLAENMGHSEEYSDHDSDIVFLGPVESNLEVVDLVTTDNEGDN